MIKLLRQTDYHVLKIENIKFYFRPKTYFDEIEIMSFSEKEGKFKAENLTKLSVYILENMLKKVEGLSYYDGSEFKLELENDKVSKQCMSDLASIGAATSFYNMLYKIIGDNDDDLPKNVEIIRAQNFLKSKKKK